MDERWLVILPYVPYPLTRGSYQRVFHLTRAMAEASRVDLFCLAESGEGLDQAAVFEAFCHRYHAEAFTHPVWARLFPDRLINPLPSTVRHWQAETVREALKAFTAGRAYGRIIFCDLVLLPYVREISGPDTIRIMDRSRVDWLFQTEELNTLSLTTRERLLRWENLYKIARLERSAYRELSAEIVCGPDDKTFLGSKLGDVSRIHVVANGYNHGYFSSVNWPRALTERPSVLSVKRLADCAT